MRRCVHGCTYAVETQAYGCAQVEQRTTPGMEEVE